MTRQEILKKIVISNQKPLGLIIDIEEVLIYGNFRPFIAYYNQTKQVLKQRQKNSNFDEILFVKYIFNGLSKILKSVDFVKAYAIKHNKTFKYEEEIAYNLSFSILNLMMNDFKL